MCSFTWYEVLSKNSFRKKKLCIFYVIIYPEKMKEETSKILNYFYVFKASMSVFKGDSEN